jgi:diadenosine tetraphosphate (Ap4A) HIT family hydrolase
MGCLVCERIAKIREGTNPYFVAELETGYAVIGDHQHFRGYTVFLCKEHVSELHELPKEYLQKHLMEMAIVAQAVYEAFHPEKMNYELLGNGETHVHWHLFPRNAGDTPKPGPVWLLPQEEMYADANRPSPGELKEMAALLKEHITRLIPS